MKKCTFILLLCLFTLISCKKEKDNNGDNGEQVQYIFYGEPFAGVPDVVDVIMYEANQRVFASNNSLNAITERLDEIKSLSVNVLWLMPINEQGVEKGIGSPYCVKNYLTVEPEYGTLDDLRNLVKQSHEKGMAVIIDWVANHTSWDNEWISNKSWYTQNALGNIVSPPGTNWLDVADLNFSNMDMRKAMIEAMKYWIIEANIDGYRFDAADFVPVSFWRDAVSELRKLQEHQEGRKLLLLAEGARVSNFQADFDMDYSWNFYHYLKQLYKGESSITKLYESHQNEYAAIPAGKHKLRFTTNHDESAWDATPVTLFGGQRGAMSAFVLTITIGGSPLIYSTQEIGYSSTVPFFSSTKIDWNQNPTIYEEYKTLMGVYAASPALRRGNLQIFGINPDVACFYRTEGDDAVLTIVNIRNSSKTFSVPELFVNTNWKNLMDNADVTLQTTLQLEPYQYLILGRQ